MPNKTPYIQVILPLRLEWEPYYTVEEDQSVAVGDRVEVVFAGRRYVGVVCAVNVTPTPGIKSILPARSSALPAIFPEEIRFWQEIARYYLCTLGEVYKAA